MEEGEIDISIEFRCPKCKGSHFGTSFWEDGEVERHCHDEYRRHCTWSGDYDFDAVHDKVVGVIKQLSIDTGCSPQTIERIWQTMKDLPIR